MTGSSVSAAVGAEEGSGHREGGREVLLPLVALSQSSRLNQRLRAQEAALGPRERWLGLCSAFPQVQPLNQRNPPGGPGALQMHLVTVLHSLREAGQERVPCAPGSPVITLPGDSWLTVPARHWVLHTVSSASVSGSRRPAQPQPRRGPPPFPLVTGVIS